MEIRNAVAHRLEKARNVRGATVHPADAEIVKNEAFTALFQNVLESYNSRCSRHTGSFQEDEENYRFSVGARAYVAGEMEFLAFTVTAMERLRVQINDVTFAGGGYVLFVRYLHANRDMLLVAKLNAEAGAIFTPDLHEVVQSEYLNLDRLQVAARVDLEGWKGGDDRYLTFVLKQDRGSPSDYFREFIGCRINQDSKIESNKLVKVVKEFANKLADDGVIPAEGVPDVQRRAFDYASELIKGHEKQPLLFDTLANAVWPEEPEKFMRFLNDHPEQPSSGFIPDRTTLKKLSDINFKSRELTVKMTYEFKLQHVSTEGNRVVITDAPAKLVKELTEG